MQQSSLSASTTTVLHSKHMVCPRGIRVVRQELEGLGLHVLEVRLGAATVMRAPEALDWPRLRATSEAARFALLETDQHTLLERVSTAVRKCLRHPDEWLRHRVFGTAVANELGLSYGQLCSTFSRLSVGNTLPGYILSQRLVYAQAQGCNMAFLLIGWKILKVAMLSIPSNNVFNEVHGCSPALFTFSCFRSTFTLAMW